jgi:hypothetical protein
MSAGVPAFTVDRADPRAGEPSDDLGIDEEEEQQDDDDGLDFIPTEEFDQLPPAVKLELKRRARQNERLEKKLDSLTTAVAANINRAPAQSVPVDNGTKDPWTDVTDQALHQYKTRVRGWQQRLAANSEDAEAAEAVKGIDWENFAKVEQELTRRAVRAEVGGLREELRESRKKEALDNRLNTSLLQEFDMAEIRDEALQGEARSIVGDVFNSLGLEADLQSNPDAMAVATLLGMKLAKANTAQNRRKRTVRRSHLDLEGPSPRTSTRGSKRSAAAARGDWEAVESMDLDDFIVANGL